MAEGSNKYNGFPQGPSKLIKPQDLVPVYLNLPASAMSVICLRERLTMPRMSFMKTTRDDNTHLCRNSTTRPLVRRPDDPCLRSWDENLPRWPWGASGLEAIMKRFPPRSDTLVSNALRNPLTHTLSLSLAAPNLCRQACESDDARSCNAFHLKRCTALCDLETGNACRSVHDVIISTFSCPLPPSVNRRHEL